MKFKPKKINCKPFHMFPLWKYRKSFIKIVRNFIIKGKVVWSVKPKYSSSVLQRRIRHPWLDRHILCLVPQMRISPNGSTSYQARNHRNSAQVTMKLIQPKSLLKQLALWKTGVILFELVQLNPLINNKKAWMSNSNSERGCLNLRLDKNIILKIARGLTSKYS